MAAPTATYDLVQQFQNRLTQCTSERNQNQQLTKTLDDKLRIAFQRAPKRPLVAEDQLNKQIEELEFKRSTTSLTLNAEKQLLKEIEGLKAKKQQIKEYVAFQEMVEDLKQKKAEAYSKAKHADDSIGDIQKGLKRLELAQNLKCAPKDIREFQMTIPEGRIGGVIGKNGAKLRQLESECQVIMEMEAKGTTLKIIGNDAGIANAQEKVEEITCSVEEQMGVHPDTVAVLLARKGRLLQDLQTSSNVRIDLNRAEGILTFRGIPRKIQSVKQSINNSTKGKLEIDVPTRLIPLIIGKSGNNITQLMEETGAVVEVDRVLNQVRLRGTKEAVQIAKKKVETILIENEEHEQDFPVTPSILLYLMEDKGAVLKELRHGLLNFHIDIDRPNNVLHVKGTKNQLADFGKRLADHISIYEKSITPISVDKHIIGVVIGKGGSTIKQLSQDTGSTIDVDKKELQLLLRGEPEQVEAAKLAIQEIIRKNHRYIFTTNDAVLGALMQKNREELQKIQEETKSQLTVLRREGEVYVTGTEEQVNAGRQALQRFVLRNLVETVDIDMEEITTIIGPGGATIVALQEETQTSIDIDKKNSTISFRGSQEGIDQAKLAVERLTKGSGNGDNVLVKVDPDAIPTIIGKQGSMIKKLRETYSVSVDVYGTRGSIRVKGDPEQVSLCKDAIEQLLVDTIVTEVFTVQSPRVKAIEDSIPEIEGMIGSKVQWNEKEKKLRVRTCAGKIGPAKRFVEMILKDYIQAIITLSGDFMKSLLGKGDLNVQRIRDQSNASIAIDEFHQQVTIHGRVASVYQAQDALERLLQFYFPDNFEEVSAPVSSLVVLFPLKRQLCDELDVQIRFITSNSTSTSLFSLTTKPKQTNVKIYGASIANVQKAKTLLTKEIEGYSKKHAEIIVDGGLIGTLVGKKGSKINAFTEATGAIIHVDSATHTVSIQGEEEQVQKAIQMINELIDKYSKSTISIAISSDDIPAIIGKGGKMIRQLQEESGAMIHVSRNDGSDSGNIRIHSEDESIRENAKEKIEELLRQNHRLVLTIPSHQAYSLIGKGGQTIRELQETFEVDIRVDKDNGQCILRGKDENINAAKLEIEKILNTIPTRTSSTPPPPPGTTSTSSASTSSKKETQPSESMPIDEGYRAIPVGMAPAAAQELNWNKMSKNQRRRARKRMEQQKSSNEGQVISMLMGNDSSSSNTIPSQSTSSTSKGNVNELEQFLLGTGPSIPASSTTGGVYGKVGSAIGSNGTTSNKTDSNGTSYYHSSSGYSLRL